MEQRDFKSWPQAYHSRPRLLIEDPDPALRVADFHRFTEAGLDVALCSGPDHGEGCRLVELGDCPMAAAADVILMGRDLGESRAEIAAALHRHHPDVPVIAKVPRQGSEEAPDGCVPLPTPISVDGQIRAVWRAVELPAGTARHPERVTPMPAPPCSTAESATEARLLDLLGW
jgi:hypothetical protein